MTSPSLRRLAERLSEVERQVTAFNAPQLGSSSIEGGAVEAYTPDGQLTLRVGQQHDGTNTAVVLAGPTPPVPVGLTVTGGQRSATATWDGSWVDNAVSPMDFARVEVHVTSASVSLPDPGFDSATRVGSIESQAGASLTFALDPGESWVWLIARAQSGKASAPGGPVRVEVADAIDTAAVEEALQSIAAIVRIDSSRGVLFKSNQIATTLTVTVFRGNKTITDVLDLQAEFGPGSYIEWQWQRMDESDFGVISSADPRLRRGGFDLVISPADVDEKTVFRAVVNGGN